VERDHELPHDMRRNPSRPNHKRFAAQDPPQKTETPASTAKSAHTTSLLPCGAKIANWESIMAKGQMRSNREVKKPKQEKKPQPATTPSGAPPIRVAPTVSATQKKH
jgi:hypothetical protein